MNAMRVEELYSSCFNLYAASRITTFFHVLEIHLPSGAQFMNAMRVEKLYLSCTNLCAASRITSLCHGLETQIKA